MTPRSLALLAAVAPALALAASAGCHRGGGEPAGYIERKVAAGVVFRELPEGHPCTPSSTVHVLDVDLGAPGVRARVVAGADYTAGGRSFARAETVRDWCAQTGAAGGVNGGFFGATSGIDKEVVGLLAADGIVRGTGQLVQSTRDPGQRYVRSVFGIDQSGRPRIGWSVGRRGRAAYLTEYGAPVNPTTQRFWNARSAVACGPRLIERGAVRVTDREERLMSDLQVRRTFVGFDVVGGRPRHLVLCAADAMRYSDAAQFLQRYFSRYHHTGCAEAMCLDGGGSTQLTYRTSAGYADALPNTTTVPSAVIVEAK